MKTLIDTEIAKQGNGETLFEQWREYLDATNNTVETYTRAIHQFEKYLNENGITQPTRTDVLNYRESLKENHKPATVQIYITAVKLFFKWTAENGYYENIAEHVKSVKLDNTEHKRDCLTTRQVQMLLSSVDRTTLKGKRDYAVLSLMVTTGLRTVSVVNANIEDIRSLGDSTVLYYKGKGHEEKAVYVKLAEQVEDAIREYLSERGETDGKQPLFASLAIRNNGERQTTRSISRMVKEYLQGIGLDSDRLTAHSLRHTTATLNLLNGGTVEETQQLLNHASINTTMIYVHALERAKNESENRIASAIFA